jgi:hypothetical protein
VGDRKRSPNRGVREREMRGRERKKERKVRFGERDGNESDYNKGVYVREESNIGRGARGTERKEGKRDREKGK